LKGFRGTPQWPAIAPIGIELRVVAFLERAKRTLHERIVVEEGKENRDALDNGGTQFVLDGKPVVLIPAFDSVENFALHRIGGVR
jgi:hypothetical protein